MVSVLTTINWSFFNDLIIVVTRKTSHTRVVTATITMIYLLNTGQLALEWRLLQSAFVDSGETRNTIYIASRSSDWVGFASQICTAATSVLVDGLLVGIHFDHPFQVQSLKAWKDLEMFLCLESVTSRHLFTIFLPCCRDR